MTLATFLDSAAAEGYARWESVERVLAENPTLPIDEVLAAIERAGLKIVDEAQIDLGLDENEEVLDDPVRVYLKEMNRGPALSPERERKLTEAMSHSETAKKDLVEANLRIPVALAGHFPRPGVHILDLTIEGNEGLLEAANTFETSGGYRFRPYAYWCVRRRIKS